jgi:signal transduction histidine kinase
MTMLTAEQPIARDAGLDRLFLVAIASCLVATGIVLVPGVHGHQIQPAVDLALDTVAAVVCFTLTTLAWARFREQHVIAAAYHAAAFMALSTAYGIAVVVSLEYASDLPRLALPENVQVLVFAVSRFAAASLFVVAGVLTRRRTYGLGSTWILVTPSLGVLLAMLIGHAIYPPPDALQIITFNDNTGLPTITPFGAVLHVTTSGLFFVGALSSRRLWHAGRAVIDGWIAVGLVFAGFAELHWALYPSAHPGQVSIADLLRLVCSMCLVAGLAGAMRASHRELRMANASLAELRAAEVERAALEERARLARELHDGLAQDLWLAKLRTGEILAAPGLPDDARRAAEGAVAAIDVGLNGARDAVTALRGVAHNDSGFCTLVRRAVEDQGDRYGLRVEFSFEGDHDARIDARTQAEMLRMLQEAMNNVARHADATLVGVRLALANGRISLRIADNGHGFDVAASKAGSYGLASMRERAALIGARLVITSDAGSGTIVAITAPWSRPVVDARMAAR